MIITKADFMIDNSYILATCKVCGATEKVSTLAHDITGKQVLVPQASIDKQLRKFNASHTKSHKEEV